MAAFKTLVFLFFLCFESISGDGDGNGNSSFLFNGFDKNIVLFRDSKFVNGGSSIQLTNSVSQSEGRVLYKKPIKLFEGKGEGRNFSGSFSTHFEFSMFGSVLGFVMVPSGLDLRVFDRKDSETSSGLGFVLDKEVVAVEFGISKRGKDRVGILVGRPEVAKIRKLTSFGHHFNKLNCWIDYEASSKRLEVRLSVSKGFKPVDPFVSYLVDLVKVWRDGEFMVGLVSKNGNSSRSHYLHSWSFRLRHPSVKIHSQPLDPSAVSKTVKEEEEKKVEEVKGKGKCVWKMLGALVLGAVCGTLGAMLALYLWTVCGNIRSMAIVPEEYAKEKEKSDEESKK